MEEKKIKQSGNCVIKYEARLAAEGDIDADLEIEGTGTDILVGIRSIIDGVCNGNDIPISLYLKWIAGLVVEGTSVDIGAIENAMEENGHE